MGDPCVFCEIVAGTRPASAVYEDDTALAFMDINPVTTGHLLVVPKRHAPYLADLDEPTGAHLFIIAMRLAAAIRHAPVRWRGSTSSSRTARRRSRRFSMSTCMSSPASRATRSKSRQTGP
jgi:diadenosine tetraphosphate (Ap4A) HIT family hydrolase